MYSGRNVSEAEALDINALWAVLSVIEVDSVGACDVGYGNVLLTVRADIPAVSAAHLRGAILAANAAGGKGTDGKSHDGDDMDHFD